MNAKATKNQPSPVHPPFVNPQLQPRFAIGHIILVAIIYFLISQGVVTLATLPGKVSPVWFGAGFNLAAVLLLGNQALIGIALGCFILEISLFGISIPGFFASLGITSGVTLEMGIAAALIQRYVGQRHPLNRVSDVFYFVFVGAFLSSIVGATFGPTSLCLTGNAPWIAYPKIWWTWWLAEAMGILLFTPVFLAWHQEKQEFWSRLRRRFIEGLALLFFVAAVSKITFGGGYPVVYLLIPLLVWAAFRFGQMGATLLLVIISIISVLGTVQGHGPFWQQSLNESLLLLETFVGVVALMILVLLAVISESKHAKIELLETNERLEDKVQERTIQLGQANAEIIQLNEKLKLENLRLSAEIDIVRQMQQMILPKSEELQLIETLDIAGYMEPASEVGGDYYDVLDHGGIITIGIGDVTGHGLESGILMVMAQTAIRTLKEIPESNPTRFLDILNRTLYKNVKRMNSDKNLTLAILNYADGCVSISGQHEEILVIRKNSRIERIDTMELGFPIGLEEKIADFVNNVLVKLEPGDGILLYTDGITEAENIDGNLYGLDRLCKTVSTHWNQKAAQIQQAVIDDLRQFIGEQKIYDDITLVVLKQKDIFSV